MITPISIAKSFLKTAILPDAVLDTIVIRTTSAKRLTQYVIVTTGDTRGLQDTTNDHNNHRESINLGTPSPGELVEIQVLINTYNRKKQQEFNKRAKLLQSLEKNTWQNEFPQNEDQKKKN